MSTCTSWSVGQLRELSFVQPEAGSSSEPRRLDLLDAGHMPGKHLEERRLGDGAADKRANAKNTRCQNQENDRSENCHFQSFPECTAMPSNDFPRPDLGPASILNERNTHASDLAVARFADGR